LLRNRLPVRFELTPGQAHDAPVCKRLLDALQPGQYVLAPLGMFPAETPWRAMDKAYDAEIYKKPNKIERFFGRLKAPIRRIATRYEKTSRNFLAMVKLASIRLWIEFVSRLPKPRRRRRGAALPAAFRADRGRGGQPSVRGPAWSVRGITQGGVAVTSRAYEPFGETCFDALATPAEDHS